MAVGYHAMSSGYYGTQSITANTDIRDVSDMLDLWAHDDTPFLNRLSWGPDSGGLSIEWISEHLGWGYFENVVAVASGAVVTSALYDPVAAASYTVTTKGLIVPGTLLYFYNATDNEHGHYLVDSIGASDSIYFTVIGTTTTMPASSKLYVLGNFANEGSDPNPDQSRTRSILSNKFAILRKDINITGSQAATDMYAVPNELRHQIRLRLLEMQREREMAVLYSVNQARSTTAAGLFDGAYGFLKSQSGANIDTTTTAFTETALNNMVAECWDNRGKPSVVVGNKNIIRKFTAWDRSRVRTAQDEHVGGSWVTRYLTDIGIEVELLPLRKVPLNLLFVLDTSKIKLRAKTGRKAIVEKLGKTGDYEQWQMLSEFSVEMMGYDKGQQGMFTALTS